MVLWWGISAHWAIPLVWLGSAVVAARVLADGPRLFVDRGTTWPAAIPVVYVLRPLAVGHGGRPASSGRTAASWPRCRSSTPTSPRRSCRPASVSRSPSDFDAELLGWVYDLALQPLDEFKGFDWGEQIHGPTCARYQLNMLGYGLAALRRQLPARTPRSRSSRRWPT